MLFNWIWQLFLGHFIAAMIVYLNHRFVFHGPLKKLPGLKKIAWIHAMHHKHAYDQVDNYIFVPIWGQISVTSVIVLSALIFGWPFAVGMFSFSMLYMYRHWAIHNTDHTSKFFLHHSYHHLVSTKKNFSGIYPFIDRIFGTYVETKK